MNPNNEKTGLAQFKPASPKERFMAQKITYAQGCQIKYRLNLGRITQETVAKHAGCSSVMVAQFLAGVKGSKRVEFALLKLLGYKSLDHIFETFGRGKKGGAA
jgi:hypothetical protein